MSYLLYWFLAEDVETVPQSELTYQTWGPWSNSWWVVGVGGILHIKQNRHQTFTNNTKYYWIGLSSFRTQTNQSEHEISHKTPNIIEQYSYFPPGNLPVWKNSSSNRVSILGLSVGSPLSNFMMRFLAGRLTLEGTWYSFFFIFMYVSLRHDVSNGGLPTSKVYLLK